MELKDLEKRVQMGGCHGKPGENIYQYAWDKGIRLFDTGYGYRGKLVNNKELGVFFKDKKREDFMISDKLPLFGQMYKDEFGKTLEEMDTDELEFAIRAVFDLQCKTLGVDFIDIYQYHAIYDLKYLPGFDLVKETELYKRIGRILLKMKEEGLIKHIGFSSHNNFSNLYYFISEMENALGKGFMDVAEISYNVLNNTGCDKNNPTWIGKQYGVMIWDAAGLDGLKFLKDHGFFILDMMPNESGRITTVSTAPDFLEWNYRFIRDTEPKIDVVLAGTTNKKHLDQMVGIIDEESDLNNIPDMRNIESGVHHCHE